jgi:putative protease
VKAAVENGADAIYFGLDRFNARMRSQNFTEADLPELMAFLHRRGVKGYVTLNTLIFTSELQAAEQYLRTMITAGVDAVIVQDVGICRLIRHLSPDFPIHASTQMTITSAAGVAFAQSLGCQLVVLARECSLKEIGKIQQQLVERAGDDRALVLPLEVFVHGALCVAYSGQCLTSEALGGRSANRGECAQACRMPYDLIVDGKLMDLGDRKYLLSPQDLAGLEVLPQLIQAGVHCLKIEGRLKTPEYVANVTRVYRQALDRILDRQAVGFCRERFAVTQRNRPPNGRGEWGVGGEEQRERGEGRREKGDQKGALVVNLGDRDRYNLEMAFSRGLYSGWFGGINNQELVHARFGKKRGVYLGQVTRIQNDKITIHPTTDPKHGLLQKGQNTQKSKFATPTKSNGQNLPSKIPTHFLKPGDGVVFDNGHPATQEEGGRIYTVEQRGMEAILTFGRQAINLQRIQVGDRVWKTSDPELDRQLRQSFAGDHPKYQRPIFVEVHGEIGQPLVAIARDEQGHIAQVKSTLPLVAAHTQPLTSDRLQEQFARLGNTPFYLEQITNHACNNGLLPISELNRLRRELITQLENLRSQPKQWQLRSPTSHARSAESSAEVTERAHGESPLPIPPSPSHPPTLIALIRNLQQLQAALTTNLQTLYCEFEDPRTYRQAIQQVKNSPSSSRAFSPSHPPSLYIAPPRITKPGETWILKQVRDCDADGFLIRNYDHLQFFAETHDLSRCIGDFSLNVANPLTADYFKQQFGLKRLTASYDLNIQQLEDLLNHCPPDWFEVTIHQHMPMFHMEHCVFCAFLSEGTDYTNCGRPCEKHVVRLRDRVGTEHQLQADAGCRNTIFNGTAQTGAESVKRLLNIGLRHFRIEFVDETPAQVIQTIQHYQQLLQGQITGSQLWRTLKLQNQLGVTRGSREF